MRAPRGGSGDTLCADLDVEAMGEILGISEPRSRGGDGYAPFCDIADPVVAGQDVQVTDLSGDPLDLSLEENRALDAADVTDLVDRDIPDIGDSAYVVAGRSSGVALATAQVEGGDERYGLVLFGSEQETPGPEELADLAEQLLALTPAA